VRQYCLLIIGMLGAPLPAAVQYHLGIHRIGLNLAPVVIGSAMPLALCLAANALLESIWGWVKTSLAIRTAAGLGQCVSSEIERDSNFLSKADNAV
jgi:NO-binding membrane sensor protein with MHYT domain